MSIKLDDQIYVEEGFRKEQVEKAIILYGLDKKKPAEPAEHQHSENCNHEHESHN
jgi:hypothetical protein